MRRASCLAPAVVAVAVWSGLWSGTASAEEEPPEMAKPTPVSKSNAQVRAEEEKKETALPSVGGRPRRRYAERNVIELGGALSFIRATGFTQFGATPTFGWFFIDYVQISLLPSIEYVSTFSSSGKARLSFLVEPSFHIFATGPLFVFFGAGAGAAYERDTGLGLAVAPRAGVNVLIGGNGLLNFALAYVYTATRRTAIEDGADTPHTSTFGIQAGYSVAW